MTVREPVHSRGKSRIRSQSASMKQRREMRMMARRDFWCFILHLFKVLHQGQALAPADYLLLLASVMMDVGEGALQRVVINMPPRHLKSMLVSVFYVAWRLGRDPTAKFITISYGDDLAHDLADKTRLLMQSKEYRALFPGTVLQKKAQHHITTTKGGARYATAVGSDITGFGADEIIIDDPMEPNDAASETVKEKVRHWVTSSVMTRFNNPTNARLILVMQRLAPDDLSSTLSPSADLVLRLPMVAEDDECITAGSEHYRVVFRRKTGEVLCPARFPPDVFAKRKADVGPHEWDSQYQQRPGIGGTGMLSLDLFQRFDLTAPPPFEMTIHSWDVGATVRGAYSVCTKWGVGIGLNGRGLLYLIGIIRIRQQLPELEAIIRRENINDRPALIVVDERGVGMGLYQRLKLDLLNVAGSTATINAEEWAEPAAHPGRSKVDRFGRASFVIGDGRVYIPHKAEWLESFLYEVGAFPSIPDKDQVDSMTQVIGNVERCLLEARRCLSHGWCLPQKPKGTKEAAASTVPEIEGSRRMKVGDKIPPTRPRKTYAKSEETA